MAPRTITFTRDALLTRRDSLLREAGVSLEEFRRRASRGALVGDEWYLAEDLEEIEFLLDDEPTSR